MQIEKPNDPRARDARIFQLKNKPPVLLFLASVDETDDELLARHDIQRDDVTSSACWCRICRPLRQLEFNNALTSLLSILDNYPAEILQQWSELLGEDNNPESKLYPELHRRLGVEIHRLLDEFNAGVLKMKSDIESSKLKSE